MHNAGDAAGYWVKPVWGLTLRSCGAFILPTGGSSAHCKSFVTILEKILLHLLYTFAPFRRSDLYFFSLSTVFKSISTGACSSHRRRYQSASHSFLLTPPSTLPQEYIWEHARSPQRPVRSVGLKQMFERGLELTPDKMETQNKRQKKGKMKTHDSYSISQHIGKSGQWIPNRKWSGG